VFTSLLNACERGYQFQKATELFKIMQARIFPMLALLPKAG
jgi:pentatricopeptide repeat protein